MDASCSGFNTSTLAHRCRQGASTPTRLGAEQPCVVAVDAFRALLSEPAILAWLLSSEPWRPQRLTSNPSSIALNAGITRREVSAGSAALAIHSAASVEEPVIIRAAASGSMSARTTPSA